MRRRGVADALASWGPASSARTSRCRRHGAVRQSGDWRSQDRRAWLADSVIEVGKLLLEMFDFGEVEGGYVGVVGVKGGVILVVVFGAIEGFEGGDLGDDGAAEYFGLIELLDVGLGDALLIGSGEENCGAVLRAAVWTLAIQFRRVSCDREKNFQELAQSDLRRIVDDLYGFGVPGFAAADLFVVGIFHGAAGVAGGGAGDAFYVLEDGLNAPEAAAGNDERGLAFLRGEGFVHRGIGERCGGAGDTVTERGICDQESGTDS
jgi:hypothetical protein